MRTNGAFSENEMKLVVQGIQNCGLRVRFADDTYVPSSVQKHLSARRICYSFILVTEYLWKMVNVFPPRHLRNDIVTNQKIV